MIQFYSPDIAHSPFLPEGDSSHCCRVLRLKSGDEIVVTDGKGKRYFCKIINADPRHTGLKIIREEESQKERDYHLTLAVAPTKNSDRMEWLVEKAVEIGVDQIVLLKCRRSERKVQKSERLIKVMIAAMKQSLSVYLPILTEIQDYKDFIQTVPSDSQKFLGYCSQDYPRREFAKECKAGGSVIVMIGPEGDFTEEEVSEAVLQGFLPVTFGDKRLRTETAGVYAVCAVNVINQITKD